MSKEAMKQWADDVSKAYDILAFGHTERASEILGKTRDAIRKALAEQHLQDLHDENVRLGLYEQEQGSTTCDKPVAWALYKGKHLDSFWMDKGDAYDYKFTSEYEWKPLYTTPQQPEEKNT